jgi:hypothetical protein
MTTYMNCSSFSDIIRQDLTDQNLLIQLVLLPLALPLTLLLP